MALIGLLLYHHPPQVSSNLCRPPPAHSDHSTCDFLCEREAPGKPVSNLTSALSHPKLRLPWIQGHQASVRCHGQQPGVTSRRASEYGEFHTSSLSQSKQHLTGTGRGSRPEVMTSRKMLARNYALQNGNGYCHTPFFLKQNFCSFCNSQHGICASFSFALFALLILCQQCSEKHKVTRLLVK